MEKGHKEALQVEFPELAPRIFLLTEMIDDCQDIKDPIGGSMADYLQTVQELEDLINQGYEKICKLAKVEQA
jgi:protein-tyrosine-phosphatase